MEAKLQYGNGMVGRGLHVCIIPRNGSHKLLSRHKRLPNKSMGIKMKAILGFQILFFFFAGTLIVNHEVACAKAQAISEVIISLPLKSLMEMKV